MDFLNRLPIGIQDFEKLREENCFFVDKTDLIYKLVNSGNSYFFCRPRLFGKTLLISMLESYFHGRRDLFEGLAIESMEKDWQNCTVLKIDFSTGLYKTPGALESSLEYFLSVNEEGFGRYPQQLTYGKRFERVIREHYNKSGKPVVVLVDDYDKPILDSIFTEHEKHNRDVLEEFLSALNGNDFYLKFVFVTGITKFAAHNFFNAKNQLKDISTYAAFSELCGFSERDVHRLLTTAKNLKPVEEKKNKTKKTKVDGEKSEETVTNSVENVSAEKVFELLDKWYGGYRFANDSDMIFNPHSILNCLDANECEDFLSGNIRHLFWVQTGNPYGLVKNLFDRDYELFNILYGIKVDREDLMEHNPEQNDLLSLVYQSGFLTRTGDDQGGTVHLAMPNKEVAEGMLKNLLLIFTSVGSISKSVTELEALKNLLATKNVGAFVKRFESILDFKKIKEITNKKIEYDAIYKFVFHVISNLIGEDVSSDTNSDVMFSVLDGDGNFQGYVFQLKSDMGLELSEVTEDAFTRIEEREFAQRFEEQGVPCKKVVIVFSSSKSGVSGWKAK